VPTSAREWRRKSEERKRVQRMKRRERVEDIDAASEN